MRINTLVLPIAALAWAVSAVEKPLDIEVTHKVECKRKTKVGDKIEVHYRGTLDSDGSEFDASYNRGQPFTFHLGKGQVIQGWDKGLTDMCVGEKRRLTVAPEYGYGERSVGPIPAGSTLIFETELIGIPSASKDEL